MITDEEKREAVEFLRSGECLYWAERRKTPLDCSRCMRVSEMLSAITTRFANWIAAAPARGRSSQT